jgi:hypothetical protein
MSILAKAIDLEKRVKRFIFNEKWFPILVIIIMLLLSGCDSNPNAREGLLSVGFFLLGCSIGYIYAQAQTDKIFGIVKERIDILFEDLVSDLSRYALIAGESYAKTKETIHKYKQQAKDILSKKQKN